jgi:hypothetical protein
MLRVRSSLLLRWLAKPAVATIIEVTVMSWGLERRA